MFASLHHHCCPVATGWLIHWRCAVKILCSYIYLKTLYTQTSSLYLYTSLIYTVQPLLTMALSYEMQIHGKKCWTFAVSETTLLKGFRITFRIDLYCLFVFFFFIKRFDSKIFYIKYANCPTICCGCKILLLENKLCNGNNGTYNNVEQNQLSCSVFFLFLLHFSCYYL